MVRGTDNSKEMSRGFVRIACPGDVAQMVERLLSMQEAQGSIPCFSTFFLELLFHQVFSTKRVIGLVV